MASIHSIFEPRPIDLSECFYPPEEDSPARIAFRHNANRGESDRGHNGYFVSNRWLKWQAPWPRNALKHEVNLERRRKTIAQRPEPALANDSVVQTISQIIVEVAIATGLTRQERTQLILQIAERLAPATAVGLDGPTAEEICARFSPKRDDPIDFALNALLPHRMAGMQLSELFQANGVLYKRFTGRCYYLGKVPREVFEMPSAAQRPRTRRPTHKAAPHKTTTAKPRRSELGFSLTPMEYQTQLRAYNREQQELSRSRRRKGLTLS